MEMLQAIDNLSRAVERGDTDLSDFRESLVEISMKIKSLK